MRVIIAEKSHLPPPNEPPAFLPLGVYVTVLPSSLKAAIDEGGEVERALTPSSTAGVVSPGSRRSGIGQALEGRLKCCQSLCPVG